MTADAHDHVLERNVRLYPWYVAAFNGFAWMPVFFLYFSEHFTLANVLRLEAVYYAAVVLLEVPSGYFSDSVGRRTTMLIATLLLAGAYLLFFFYDSFALFAAAQVLLAGGIAFNSGTDTAFHYDSLAALGRTQDYDQGEAVAARNGLAAGALAALLGGAAGMVELRWAYAVSLLAVVVMLAIVLRFREPGQQDRPTLLGFGFFRQLRRCIALLKSPSLAWLFAFAVLMVVLNHVPYELYQPYLHLLGRDMPWLDRGTPLAAGVHMGLAMLLGAWAAGRSIRLRDRIGTGPTLLLTALLQTAIIAAMGVVLHSMVVVLVLLRTVPRALMSAPLNAAIAPQVDQGQRATYLSIQSMVGRLAFSLTLLLLSLVGGPGLMVEWPTLSRMLTMCAGAGLVGMVMLAITARAALQHRKPPRQ